MDFVDWIKFLVENGKTAFNDEAQTYDDNNHCMDNTLLQAFCSGQIGLQRKAQATFLAILYSKQVDDSICVFFDAHTATVKWFHIGDILFEAIMEDIKEEQKKYYSKVGRYLEMTQKQFKKLYFEKVVQCDTEEKAKEFLKLAQDVGYTWANGDDLLSDVRWSLYKDETAYFVQKNHYNQPVITYADLKYFKNSNDDIIQFKQ